jgi:hypothetical protein
MDWESRDFTPRKQPGWKSAVDLNRNYVGGREAVNKRIRQLRTELIGDICECTGWSESHVRKIVTHWLIGKRKPPKGPDAWAVSPAAERLLDLKERVSVAPAKGEGWRSAAELTQTYRGGSILINARLREFREQLIMDLFEVKVEEEKDYVEWLVDVLFIGLRKPISGREAIAISADGIKVAEWLGYLEPKRANNHSRQYKIILCMRPNSSSVFMQFLT